MTKSRPISANERIIDPMIALARCTQQDRVIVAGSKAIELMSVLQHRGYLRAAASANCGHPAKQYSVALVDWRQRPLQALETTLDWLADYLNDAGVLVVWVDPQKPAASQNLRATLQRYGFRVGPEAAYDYGLAISARRFEIRPISEAA
jgi:acetolactate synthase regulatory subunit